MGTKNERMKEGGRMVRCGGEGGGAVARACGAHATTMAEAKAKATAA